MATINQIKQVYYNLLNVNIDIYENDQISAFKIDNIWIDNIEEDYFLNKADDFLELLHNHFESNENPIKLIDELNIVFKNRLIELERYKELNVLDYITKYHNSCIINATDAILEEMKKECHNLFSDAALSQNHELGSYAFKKVSFYNMIKSSKVNSKSSFDFIHLLFHISQQIDQIKRVQSIFDKMITDKNDYFVTNFKDYLMKRKQIDGKKINVNLALKELAMLLVFLDANKIFVLNANGKKNRNELAYFFESNFRYKDSKGNYKSFSNFFKEISRSADLENKENFLIKMNNFLDDFKGHNIARQNN